MSGTKAIRNGITGLGLRSPGAGVLSMPNKPGCLTGKLGGVTVYAGTRGGRPTPPVVRLDLEAETQGARAVIASAFVEVGTARPVIVAEGFPCDAFHVRLSSTDGKAEVTVVMIALDCCGATSITVPPALQEIPVDDFTAAGLTLQDVSAMIAPPMAPYGA